MDDLSKGLSITLNAFHAKINSVIEALPSEQRAKFEELFFAKKNKIEASYLPMTKEQEELFKTHFTIPKINHAKDSE